MSKATHAAHCPRSRLTTRTASSPQAIRGSRVTAPGALGQHTRSQTAAAVARGDVRRPDAAAFGAAVPGPPPLSTTLPPRARSLRHGPRPAGGWVRGLPAVVGAGACVGLMRSVHTRVPFLRSSLAALPPRSARVSVSVSPAGPPGLAWHFISWRKEAPLA